MLYSFMPVLMAIFGGMGSLFGPVIGAAFFTYLEEFLITRFAELYMLIFGVIAMRAYHNYFGRLKRGELDQPHAAPPMKDIVEGKDVE